MIQSLLFVINALLILAIVASGVCWVRILIRRQGFPIREKIESLLPPRVIQRRPGSTDDGLIIFVTALIMFGTMFIAAQVLMVGMMRTGWIEIVTPAEVAEDTDPERVADIATAQHRTPSSLIASIVASSVAGVFSVLVSLGWMRLFFRHPLPAIGLSLHPFDALLGLKASLLILPPVLLISAAMAILVPYEHPVLESLVALATPTVILATLIGTAIVTPIVEEVLLRGLMQGGLQRLADPPLDEEGQWWPQSFWPVVATSFLFSLLHVGQGAAPIPLFFLSLGLGYLYRQTGNLTAPIVVHMVLNSMTLGVELLKLQS